MPIENFKPKSFVSFIPMKLKKTSNISFMFQSQYLLDNKSYLKSEFQPFDHTFHKMKFSFIKLGNYVQKIFQSKHK